MITIQTIIVSILFIPVILQIILPLGMTTLWAVTKLYKRIVPAKTQMAHNEVIIAN